MDKLRDALGAALDMETGFQKADQNFTLVCNQAIQAIEGSDPATAIGLLAFLRDQGAVLCREGEKGSSQLRQLLRVALRLIETIEIQRSAMDAHQIQIPAPELDQWVSRQIDDLDPDRV